MVEVIKSVLTRSIIVDTTRVHLEPHGRSVNGDRDGGVVGESVLEVGLRSGGDVLVSGDVGLDLSLTVTALVSRGGEVGVLLLGLHTVLDGVRESVSHPSTDVAGVGTTVDTVDKLLLRELDEVSGGKSVSSLHGSGGRERPARSALSLVLDTGHNSLLAPIDRVGEGLLRGGVKRGDTGRSGELELGGSEDNLLVLGVGEIGELGESEVEGGLATVVLLVVSLDELEVVTEDVETEIDLVDTVLLSVESLELLEEEVILGVRAGHGGGHDGEESDKKKLVHVGNGFKISMVIGTEVTGRDRGQTTFYFKLATN